MLEARWWYFPVSHSKLRKVPRARGGGVEFNLFARIYLIKKKKKELTMEELTNTPEVVSLLPGMSVLLLQPALILFTRQL